MIINTKNIADGHIATHMAIHIVRVALSLSREQLYRSMVVFQPTGLANSLYEIHRQTTCGATYAT